MDYASMALLCISIGSTSNMICTQQQAIGPTNPILGIYAQFPNQPAQCAKPIEFANKMQLPFCNM